MIFGVMAAPVVPWARSRRRSLRRCEEWAFPATAAAAGGARLALKAFLTDLPLDEHRMADLLCAGGEAVANAVTHGSPRGAEDECRLRCLVTTAGRLAVEVEDDGPGFDPGDVPLLPAVESEHGRGLFLMRIGPEVSFRFPAGGGCVCRLELEL